MPVVIERIPFESYLHPKRTANFVRDANDLDSKDLDYNTEIARTNLMNYANVIGYPIDHEYKFTKEEISKLLECAEIGIKVYRLSHLFEEDLFPIIERMEANLKDSLSCLLNGGLTCPSGQGLWFVRFNSCSPKDGKGDFPITNAKDLVEMIVTSSRARGALESGDDTLYFVKYDTEWDANKELRIFIHNQQITAISQYNPYNVSYFSDKNDSYLNNLVKRIKDYLAEIIPMVCSATETNNLVCDLYLDHNDKFRIIEFNSFGYWLATGSVLFRWLDDKDKLYNQNGVIYLRILT